MSTRGDRSETFAIANTKNRNAYLDSQALCGEQATATLLLTTTMVCCVLLCGAVLGSWQPHGGHECRQQVISRSPPRHDPRSAQVGLNSSRSLTGPFAAAPSRHTSELPPAR